MKYKNKPLSTGYMVKIETFLFCCVCCIAFAASTYMAASALTLPPVVHYDTETTTNVPFVVATSGAGRFTLSLSCIATPSNNVEAAFGCDSNNDGVLDLGEMSFTIGWDCGTFRM